MGEEKTAKDQRAIRRFALHLPVTVTAASGDHIPATAETRDVSSHGICFYCDSAIERDTTIEFTVTLPSEVTMTEPISVRCHAKVVRVENATGHGGKFAIAAAIDSYEFVASDDAQKFIETGDVPPAL